MANVVDLSREIADLVERSSSSLVTVDARRGRAASGVVWANNLVLTADHALEHEDEIKVLTGSSSLPASVAGRDPGTDLAVLKVDGLTATAATRGTSAGLRPGHLVLAIGRPGQVQVTIGIVSGMSGAYRSWRGGQVERLIETTAELLPGFSGGPLLDAEGKIVGINSWNFGRGVSRALPIETAARVVESLRAHGRIRRAYLGVGTQPVRLAEALATQVGQSTGLLVVTVEPGGPAASAGFLQGDTIVSIDGDAVRHLDDLFNAVRRLEVGSTHRLRVIRAGELKDISLTAAERTP
ncbi:MAG TPA: trypsin-like peptidase domain-containing protein [Candidatus Dormibacteraeota bacterium]|nr:trypsin-like peptidase domain-containing protein [Candidatus Dormibacteraeota bacterium]